MHDLVVDDGANSHATGIFETHQSHYNVLCLSALEADRTERLLAIWRGACPSATPSRTLVNGAPDALGCKRHFDLANVQRRERIEDRVGERRYRSGRTGLARALGSERI